MDFWKRVCWRKICCNLRLREGTCRQGQSFSLWEAAVWRHFSGSVEAAGKEICSRWWGERKEFGDYATHAWIWRAVIWAGTGNWGTDFSENAHHNNVCAKQALLALRRLDRVLICVSLFQKWENCWHEYRAIKWTWIAGHFILKNVLANLRVCWDLFFFWGAGDICKCLLSIYVLIYSRNNWDIN